jgi:FkbM family methyltransferase
VNNSLKGRLKFNYRFANTLGVGPCGRIKLFFLLIFITFRRLIYRNRTLNITLRLQKFGKRFNFFLSHQLDIAILYDIFVEDEYALPLDSDPKIIIDIGSNVGASLMYFSLKYPEAKIFGYEPDPHAFNTLKRNIEGYENISIEQTAIASSEGNIEFFIDPESSMSSSLQQRLDRQKKVLVKTKTLDNIINEHDIQEIDLLKFDVEGAEYDLFREFQQINKINNLIGELHVDLIGVSKKDFLSLLSNFRIHEEKLNLPHNVERYVIYGGKEVVSYQQ